MNELKIRNAEIEELDRIYDIETACFPEAEAASKEALHERIKVFPEGFFVGEIEGKIIGFVNGAVTGGDVLKDEFFMTMKYHEPLGGTLMVFGLDVHPDYQRKGYAAQLMNAFIEQAYKDQREKILLTCKEHLIHYYEKFGYENKGISGSEHGGAKWYDMWKVL